MNATWEIERALLGGLMLDAGQLVNVRDTLVAADFQRPQHGALWTLFLRMREEGEAIDVPSVMHRIADRLQEYGGAVGVSTMPNACASLDSLESYARRIREDAVVRRLGLVATGILERVKTVRETTLLELCAEVEREVLAVTRIADASDMRRLGDVANERRTAAHERYHQAQRGAVVTGLTTGFVDLDRKLSGWDPGDLVILAARPAMGKTALALNFATAAARAGKVVGFFSLEMTTEQLTDRALASDGRVDAHHLRTGHLTADDWRGLDAAVERAQGLGVYIDDIPGATVSLIRAKARRLRAQHGDNLGLIVVDYIQIIQGEGGPRETRENAVSAASRGLKLLAKELEIPVIALSQLNRNLEGRTEKRPQVSDLRESGAIEQDADVILLIYRDEYYNPETADKGLAEVIVGKQRRGETGTVKLAFLGRYTAFQNLASSDDMPGGYF